MLLWLTLLPLGNACTSKPQEGATQTYTDPLRHLSAPGNSRSVNTLAERSAKTHYLKMSEQTCLRGNRSCKVILMSPHVSDLKAVFACGLLTSNVFLLLLAFNKTLLKIWR